MTPTIFSHGWKIPWARLFLLVFSILAFTATSVRADLTPKQAGKLITRMAGFELPNGSVRVKSISVNGAAAAEVSAEIRSVFKFEQDKQGHWRVGEIRTGQDQWEEVDLIARALKTDLIRGACTAPDPPVRNAVPIDPSVKRARCLLGGLLGIEVLSDVIRIQQVAPLGIPLASQASAVVVAWVRVDARLVNGEMGWQVAELRTGKGEWIKLEPLVAAVEEEKQKKARTELGSIAKALERFHKDRGFYIVSDKHEVAIDRLNPRYLPQVIRFDPWHQPYKYQGERDHFTLRSAGPDGKENTSDDIQVSEVR